jgi:steroid 5-alpha reductase family enzyme
MNLPEQLALVNGLSMIYARQMLDVARLAFLAWLLGAAVMLALWVWYRFHRNAGIVDVGWSVSLPLMTVLYASMGDGQAWRRWLIAAMFCLWGGRLAVYLLRDRVVGRDEDKRYADLRARRSPAVALDFFLFFQAQALLAVVLSLPALIAAVNGEPRVSPLEIVAVLLWAAALAGESLADRQLERFKARPSSRGRTCREGLWRYSRHPNYFFEWLIWVAYALFALASPWGAVALLCPALMLYLLFRVTGIPATEAQAIRSKGDDYRRYQATTSVFVPWFPWSAS